jgi:hypothetical protein
MKNQIRIWRTCIIFALILFGVALFNQSEGSSDIPKGLAKSGDVIPAFSVPVPTNKAYRSYLMLGESGSFQPAEMDAKLIIIEVLNVY